MGLDVYLYQGRISTNNAGEEEETDNSQIEKDSAKYPAHLFKIGYFRSSYNEGGVNRVLSIMGVPTLDDIFDGGDGYYRQVDWVESLAKAKDALVQFDKTVKKMGGVRIAEDIFYDWNTDGPNTAEEALEAYLKTVSEHKKSKGKKMFGGSFSNRLGMFFLDKPIKVKAVIKGFSPYHSKGNTKETAVYVVYKSDDWKWYRQALEIVIETCEYVLGHMKDLDEGEKFYLHWSA